jgi:hypothetical protein
LICRQKESSATLEEQLGVLLDKQLGLKLRSASGVRIRNSCERDYLLKVSLLGYIAMQR